MRGRGIRGPLNFSDKKIEWSIGAKHSTIRPILRTQHFRGGIFNVSGTLFFSLVCHKTVFF